MKLQNVASNQIENIQCPDIDATKAPVTAPHSINTNHPVSQQQACIDGICIIETEKTHCTQFGGPDVSTAIVYDQLWLFGTVDAPQNTSIPSL